MLKKIMLISMALTFWVASAAQASVVDAPHNGINGVSCSSCHSYSLWWRYSPTNHSLSPNKNIIVNNVCTTCHDGSQAQIPTQRAHSSTIIGSSLHGVWESACVDCHDPHYQGQLGWVNSSAHTSPAGLYLVKGTLGTITAGTVANTTNLGYSNVPVDNLSGDWTSRSRWGKKNANPTLDRGLILVVDTNTIENTYQVISANNTVITVKGTLKSTDTGKSFGLIYGQLIKKVIKTPASGDRQVSFFDPNILYGQGGFTDQQTPRQGICQVCHTKTSHWTQDALHDGHNATLQCTNCHDAAQGFKSSLPSHAFLSNTSPCTNCHQHLANDPLAIHGNTCQTCHNNPPSLRSDSANFHTVTRIGLDPSGSALSNGKTSTACTYCHSAYFGGHTHSHATAVKANIATTPTTANCRGCHNASLSPFIGSGEAHAGSGCSTCHNLATNGGLKGSAAIATAPYGECNNCHKGYFANHDHGTSGGNQNHAVGLGADTYAAQSCAICHNTSNGNLATWNDIFAEHQNNCGFCHNSSRATNVRAAYTSVADVILKADALHPVTCLDCHASHNNDHQGRYVSPYEDGGQPTSVVLTTCAVNCHSSAFSTSSADPKRHDSCKTCHTATATPVILIGSAVGKTVPEANPFNNCYTCHGADYFQRHTNVNHSSVVKATSDNTCERCHTGDAITSASTHHGSCNLCHDQARGGVLISLAATGTGNCNACHGSNWLTIHSLANRANHSLTVAMSNACSACHATTAGTLTGIPVEPQNNTIHDGCNTCHDATGLLVGLASGHGGGANCVSCHGGFGVGAHSAVNHASQVAIAQACSSCHADAKGSATGIMVADANPKIHKACASCHGTTGGLSGAASGKTGNNDCQSCHGLFAAKHGGQDHLLTVAMATECSGCHAGTQGTASGMSISANDPKKHYSCSSCHDSSGALAGIALGKGGGADCNACHGTFANQHGVFTHATSVSLSPECASCHAGTAGAVAGIPTSSSDNTKHDNCRQCHGLDGLLLGSAASHGNTNSCNDCHAAATQHTALHFVRINEAADRGLSSNQACNACHGHDGADAGAVILDDWAEVLALHGTGNCAVCHAANREVIDNQGHSQVPAKTVAGIIAAKVNPTNCLACHLDKQQPAEHGFDHALAGIISALDRCLSCHTNPNLLVGIHAANGCKTCHDKTTAPVVLKGAAVGHGKAAVISAGVPNTCGSCHTSHAANFLNHSAPDHVARGFVLNTTNSTCDNCHQAADTIVGSDMHKNNCANCHTATPGGVSDGTLTGSATGKLSGGSCTTCHAITWLAIHQGANPAIGHLTQVSMALECSSCHAGAAGTANGMPVDSASPIQHRSCASCHNGNGELVGHATGNMGPNTCYECHGGFSAKHATTNHSTFVSMATDCSGCHTAVGNTVDPNDPKVHDACATCHNPDGSLAGSASGHSNGGSCNTCHGSFASIHATKNHSLLVSLSTDCSGCHAGTQGTASGIPLGGSSKQHSSCASCHGATGVLVSIAIGQGGGAGCNNCHGVFAVTHSKIDHAFRVALAPNCADCHTGTQGSVTGIPTSSTDNKVHDTCSQCHGTTGILVGSASGKVGATNSNPNDCSTCHGAFSNNHGLVSHNPMVTMSSNCSACHSAIGNTVSPGDPKSHHACASCHGTNGRLVGSAAAKDGGTLGGQDGGGDCSTCHRAFVNNHASVNHATKVSMATDCSGCHTATGNTVNPNDPKVHDACSTCHNANGSLAGSAIGHPGGGSCNTCHGSFATRHATKNHSTLVALSTDCSGCHAGAQGIVNGMPVGGSSKQHSSCASCHGSTGTLVSIARSQGGGAGCDNCHGLFAAKHGGKDHSFRVALAANCADCHSGTQGSLSGIPISLSDNTIHDACSQCHGATGTLIGSATGKVSASIATPNDCSTCHGTFINNHASVNHEATVSMNPNCSTCHAATGNTVSPGDPKAHHACASCHGLNGRLIGVASGKDGATLGGHDGGGDCSSCHGAFVNNHASVNHVTKVSMANDCSGCHTATGNTVDPNNPKVHDACSTCHNANGSLAGSASGHPGGGTCNTCHGSFATRHATKNHSTLVSLSTDCSGCHSGAQGTVGGIAVGGSAKQHSSCTSCHGSTGALISIAIGKGGGAGCDSCHGLFAAKHSRKDHSFRVALAANCADCHSGTQGGLTGIPTSGTDNKIHDACSQCHGTTGTLIGSATGKVSATLATPNDCSTCHGSFINNHASVNHNAMVSMNSNCSACHSAIGSTVIPGDPKAHHACASCHGVNGRLIGTAIGKDGATIGGHDGGGDCSSCHGAFVNNHASVSHSSQVSMATDCSGCHTAIGNTVNPTDPKVHDACSVCHNANGSLAGSAGGHPGGGTCNTCHGSFATRHASKNHSTLVSLSTDCSGCHVGAQGTASGIAVGGSTKQHSSCASCHGSTGTLISIAVGKGGGAGCDSCHGLFAAKHSSKDHAFRVALAANCADCHTGTEGNATGIPLSSTNNSIHDSCAQCHGTSGTLIGSASGKTGASSATPNDCSACHGAFINNHATVNHNAIVSMNSNCTGCHSSIGNTVIPADPKTHHACSSCHGLNGRLIGAASGKDGATLGGHDGGGTCSTCHGAFVNNHASVTHVSRVSMATDCSGCHTATGNNVAPNDPKVHDACGVCHNANGSLAGSAAGHTGGGTCNICHGSFATRHATKNHSTLVSLSTDCSACHNGAQGSASGMPVGGSNTKHSSCVSCHGYTGALVSIAVGKGGGADCDSCHGLFAVKHSTQDHSFRVALTADCADCHAGTEGNANGIPLSSADPEKHAACVNCHDTTGALTGSATGKQGATIATPNTCNTCHGLFAGNHATTVDHANMVSMDSNDHCSGCHTATGNTVDPNDPRVHDACTSCHGSNGRLIGKAAGKDGGTLGGNNGGGDCVTCHGEYLPNHQSVTPDSNNHNERSIYFGDGGPTCSSCHTNDSSVLGYGGSGTLLTQNDVNKLHSRPTGNECSLCHDYNVTTQANSQGLPLWNTVKTAIVNGTKRSNAIDATCVVCHDYNQSNHPYGDHSLHVPAFTATTFSKPNASKNMAYTGQTIAGAATDPAPPADAITYSKVKGPSWLTVAANGTLAGTPTKAASDSFVVAATATGGTGYATLTVTVVTSGNQAPTFLTTPFTKANGSVKAAYSGQTIAGAATDPEGDTITYSKVNGPAWLSVASDGTLSGTPTVAANDSFVIRATATGGTAEATLTITVVNRPPAFSSSPFSKANATMNGAYSGQSIAGAAVDPEGDAITYSKVSGPLWLSVAGNGTLSGTPTVAANDSFVVRATATGGSAEATLNITVVNLPPAFTPTTISKANATVGLAYSGQSIAGAAVDPEGDAITYSKVSGPAWLSVAGNGALSGTPTGAANDSFVVRATATGGTGDATLNITVVPSTVTQLDAWTNLSSAAGAVSATNLNVGSFTVSGGTKRLMLVSVVMELSAVVNKTISATYGGAPMSQSGITSSTQREIVWIGYLNDTQIGTGSKQLLLTYSGGTTQSVSGLNVKWASYSGVNQTTPIPITSGSAAVNVASATVTFGSAINYVKDGMTIVVSGNGGTAVTANSNLTATPAFTSPTTPANGYYTYANGHTIKVFTTATHTAPGTYAGTTSVVWGSGAVAYSGLVAVTLQP